MPRNDHSQYFDLTIEELLHFMEQEKPPLQIPYHHLLLRRLDECAYYPERFIALLDHKNAAIADAARAGISPHAEQFLPELLSALHSSTGRQRSHVISIYSGSAPLDQALLILEQELKSPSVECRLWGAMLTVYKYSNDPPWNQSQLNLLQQAIHEIKKSPSEGQYIEKRFATKHLKKFGLDLDRDFA